MKEIKHVLVQTSVITRGGVEDTRLEAKAEDRPSRGQGQGPRTQAQVFSEKRSSKNFSGVLQKKVFKNFFQATFKKKVFKKFFQAIYRMFAIQKILLSSSRGQGDFRGLEASRLDPRSFHCNNYFVVGGIAPDFRSFQRSNFQQRIFSNSCLLNLLLVQSHQAEIIIGKRLIQGRNNVSKHQGAG